MYSVYTYVILISCELIIIIMMIQSKQNLFNNLEPWSCKK